MIQLFLKLFYPTLLIAYEQEQGETGFFFGNKLATIFAVLILVPLAFQSTLVFTAVLITAPFFIVFADKGEFRLSVNSEEERARYQPLVARATLNWFVCGPFLIYIVSQYPDTMPFLQSYVFAFFIIWIFLHSMIKIPQR